MSRIEGFEVMDISTAVLHDPKFRRLAREYPELVADGFMAYMSTTAESWKAGERLGIEEAWPTILAFRGDVVAALKAVKLIDPRGRVTSSAWRGYFEQARSRREKSRDRWHRWKERREQETANPNENTNGRHTPAQRGANVGQRATDSDSVPTDSESTTPPTPSPARGRRNGRTTGHASSTGLTDYDARMVSDDDLDPAEPGSFAVVER